MKRLLFLLLSVMSLIPMIACSTYNRNLDGNKLETTGNTTEKSYIFDLTELSYERVVTLTDFKCYVSYQEEAFTVDGTQAKDLYYLVYNEMKDQVYKPGNSKTQHKDSVFLVFYDSEDEYPIEDYRSTSFYGFYNIYDNGTLEVSWRPQQSMAFDFKLESDLYHLVIDSISGNN